MQSPEDDSWCEYQWIEKTINLKEHTILPLHSDNSPWGHSSNFFEQLSLASLLLREFWSLPEYKVKKYIPDKISGGQG